MPIFRVKSVKIYTGQKNLHWRRRPRRRQLSGMGVSTLDWFLTEVSALSVELNKLLIEVFALNKLLDELASNKE